MIPSVKKFKKFAGKSNPEWDLNMNEEGTGFANPMVEMAYQGFLIGRQSFGVDNGSYYCLATATEEGLVFSDNPVFTDDIVRIKAMAGQMRKKTGRPMIVVGILNHDFDKAVGELQGNPLKLLVKSNKEMKNKPKKIQRRWTFFEPEAGVQSDSNISRYPRSEIVPELVKKFWVNLSRGEIDFKNVPELRFRFAGSKDMVALSMERGNYAMIGEVTTLKVTYLEYGGLNTEYCQKGEKPKPMYYTNQTQYFDPSDLDKAIECFIGRIQSEHPARVFGESQKLEMIRIRQSGELKFENHYTYLDEMLEAFWMQVFQMTPDQMYCAGIVGAHGDKGYGYKSQWEQAGIPFHRAMLIYLLTYTMAYTAEDKSKSCEWVIQMYPSYLERIQNAEEQVLRDKFGYVKA